MRRALLLLAAASLAGSACTTRDCPQEGVNVYWPQFTTSTGAAVSCSAAGVTGVQVLVNDVAQFAQLVPCSLPAQGGGFVDGTGLADFAPGTYKISVQGFDANGRLKYQDDRQVSVGNACGAFTDVDTFPVALTGTLTMSVSFAGQRSCAAAGVQNFFVELVDDAGQAVPVSNQGFIPCVDALPALPAFQIFDLEFGRSYTFRTLAGTFADVGAGPSGQRIAYQACGATVFFNAVTPSFQIDLPAAAPGAVCP
jgi:hypothetical protein